MLSNVLRFAFIMAFIWTAPVTTPVFGHDTEKAECIELPGKLNEVPVFNSNCPEVVLAEGILLSTMSKKGMNNPYAHLNYSFKGDFDIFMHHIANGTKSGHMEDLFIGLVVKNSSSKPVKLEVRKAASYLSQPDAPFIKLNSKLLNTKGNIYSGPGDRVSQNILFNIAQPGWPKKITIKPNSYSLISKLNIPVSKLVPPLNGRNTLIKCFSDGKLELAAVALFEKGNSELPGTSDFVNVLEHGNLVTPRGLKPSLPNAEKNFRYGRVAGVSIGSTWSNKSKDSKTLLLGSDKTTTSFPIASLQNGTFGTGQIQTAKLIRRYEDTAYSAHGNYGVLYDIKIPIKNISKENLQVSLSFDSPVKSDLFADKLKYLSPPSTMVFFRGSVIHDISIDRIPVESKKVHLVLHKGEKGPILSKFLLKSSQSATVRFNLIYPADSTPPQVFSICSSSLSNDNK